MKNQLGAIKTNLELYRVVMGGSGGYRRLPGGSDHFSWHTDRHIIIIYISSSLLTVRQRRFRASSNQSKTSFHNFATRQHLCPHCDHDSCHCRVQYDWPRMRRQFSYLKKSVIRKVFNIWLSDICWTWVAYVPSKSKDSTPSKLCGKSENCWLGWCNFFFISASIFGRRVPGFMPNFKFIGQ